MSGRDLRAVWLTPAGDLFSRGVSLDLPLVPSRPPEPPEPEPTPEPDEPFAHVPGSRVTGVWAALVRSVQSRDDVSPDGRIASLHKSDERIDWREWWDLGEPIAVQGRQVRPIGHLEDASTGLYLTPDGRESISAQEAVRRGFDYGRLRLSGYYFEDAE